MRDYLIPLLMIFCLLSLTGCSQSNTQVFNSYQLHQLTDEDIIEINRVACERQDRHEVIVSKTHPMQVRVDQLVLSFPTIVNGKTLSYRVYLNTVPSAWSSLNGCVRINSGLMKMLNNNELQAVIAHEIGHIALNHSITTFRHAKFAERDQNTGEFILITEQVFSQQQEIEADNYAKSLLKARNISQNGLTTMFDKLRSHQKIENSSHPSISDRKDQL